MNKLLLMGGLLAILGTASAVDLPRPAPDISIALPGGKTVKVADYKGKVVVAAFILTT